MVVGNINGMMELAHDSVNLLREIIGEAKSFGENELKSIKISDSGREIIIEDSNNSTLEYSLSEVSCILTDSIAGLWKFGESFEESIKVLLTLNISSIKQQEGNIQTVCLLFI